MRRTSKLIVASAAVAASLAAASTKASAASIFFDNFDADTTGVLPSTFAYTVGNNLTSPNSSTVVADATAPSQDNAAQIDNQTNQGFQLSRFFTSTNIFSAGYFEFGYRLNIVSIAAEGAHGNIGPNLAFGVGTAGGGYSEGIGGGSLRVLPNATGTGWRFYDPTQSFVVEGLSLNTWYDVKAVFNPTGATSGIYQMYLDGVAVGVPTAYATGPSGNVNGFALAENTGDSTVQPNQWRLDNVYATVPEPASLGLLSLGGLLMAKRRKIT